MTTAETMFFRDEVPFELLRERILPELATRCRAERRPLRIWSAAAATGQEPYSVAIILDQLAPILFGLQVDLYATDFVRHAVNRGRRGGYSELEVQRGLTAELLERYFTKRGSEYMVSDALRRRIHFNEFNLLDSFATLGKFDVILCRNVLLYFDAPTKKNVIERMIDILLPGGYLFVGGTETVFSVTNRLMRVPNAPTMVYMHGEDTVRSGHHSKACSSAA